MVRIKFLLLRPLSLSQLQLNTVAKMSSHILNNSTGEQILIYHQNWFLLEQCVSVQISFFSLFQQFFESPPPPPCGPSTSSMWSNKQKASRSILMRGDGSFFVVVKREVHGIMEKIFKCKICLSFCIGI